MAADSSSGSYSTCLDINETVVQEYPFDIYVGTSTGFLKGCRLDKQKSFNINKVDATRAKQLEVTCMNWWNGDESFLLIARRDGYVFSYEPMTGKTFRVPIKVPDGSPSIIGLKSDEKFAVSAFSNGIVSCSPLDLKLRNFSHYSEESTDPTTLEINAGSNLSCMDYSTSCEIATGGKENPLKIWDVTAPKSPIFTAKNVKNDWLNLRVPVWVTNAQFLPGSKKIVTSTGHSQIRLYDPLTPQKRPVLEILLEDKGKKYPITALAINPNSNDQLVVGTTVSTIALADLRKKSIVKNYKPGTGGGIVDLKFHPSYPIFASCGMDSYMHCFDVNSSKRTHSFYLHSPLNCALFSSELSLMDNSEIMHKKSVQNKQESQSGEGIDEDSDTEQIDDVWKDMEVVKTKKRQLKSISLEGKPKKSRKSNRTTTEKKSG